MMTLTRDEARRLLKRRMFLQQESGRPMQADERERMREEIRRHTEEFLARGGRIEVVPAQVCPAKRQAGCRELFGDQGAA